MPTRGPRRSQLFRSRFKRGNAEKRSITRTVTRANRETQNIPSVSRFCLGHFFFLPEALYVYAPAIIQTHRSLLIPLVRNLFFLVKLSSSDETQWKRIPALVDATDEIYIITRLAFWWHPHALKNLIPQMYFSNLFFFPSVSSPTIRSFQL